MTSNDTLRIDGRDITSYGNYLVKTNTVTPVPSIKFEEILLNGRITRYNQELQGYKLSFTISFIANSKQDFMNKLATLKSFLNPQSKHTIEYGLLSNLDTENPIYYKGFIDGDIQATVDSYLSLAAQVNFKCDSHRYQKVEGTQAAHGLFSITTSDNNLNYPVVEVTIPSASAPTTITFTFSTTGKTNATFVYTDQAITQHSKITFDFLNNKVYYDDNTGLFDTNYDVSGDIPYFTGIGTSTLTCDCPFKVIVEKVID